MDTEKKALLVVSFGTSFGRTRAKTIDRIEAELAAAFPDYKMYRAWTSRIIIAKIFRRDGIKIPTVKEAVEQMLADGIREVLIQPTHLINGIENERMKEDVLACGSGFESVSFAEPLLADTKDQEQAAAAVMEAFTELKKDEVLVFMGHGTAHHANSVYVSLDSKFKELGYANVFLRTVEAGSSLDTFMKRVGELHPRRVLLAPFMVVAGDHAVHDMSGEDKDSWRSRFEAKGFQVECVMKGLGEYPGIRKLYIAHAKEALAGRA